MPDGKDLRFATLNLKGDEPVEFPLWPFLIKEARGHAVTLGLQRGIIDL